MRQSHIRNFCIVAHIDHGKSTLADRLIELTGTLDKRLMREQVLDTMDLERERGITIKLNAVRMHYRAESSQLYELNLIDTPGHVDFTYEVSRSLAALIFDPSCGRHRGAAPSIRVVDGAIRPGMSITFGAPNADLYHVDEVGYLQLGHKPTERLEAGEVGYFVANIRGVRDTRPGDTVLDAEHRDAPLLPGYRDIQSMVFAGLYPTNPEQYEELRDALAKLQLNDASLHYEPETSVALGFGFRCGFLGLLHMEIVRERLEREVDLGLISTVPNAEYHVHKTDGSMDLAGNPTKLPHGSTVDRIEEPYVKARIVAPVEYIGAIMKLGQERRGVYGGMHYLDPTRVQFTWEFS